MEYSPLKRNLHSANLFLMLIETKFEASFCLCRFRLTIQIVLDRQLIIRYKTLFFSKGVNPC